MQVLGLQDWWTTTVCDRSFCVPTAVIDRTMRRRTYFCDRKLVICTPLLSTSDDDDKVFFTHFTLSQPTTIEWYTPMRVMIVSSRVEVLLLSPFFLYSDKVRLHSMKTNDNNYSISYRFYGLNAITAKQEICMCVVISVPIWSVCFCFIYARFPFY